MELEIQGIALRFHSSGAVYWQETNSLLLADLHLGKESVFQQSGLAIPSGATVNTLDSLRTLVLEYKPDRVIVLGDLLHAKTGLTADLEEKLAALIGDSICPEWILIPGNHDRGGIPTLSRCGWHIASDHMEFHGVQMTHAPKAECPNKSLSISGHLHPSIRIRLNAREMRTFRCYWLHASQLVLPAFGGWTGTKPICRMPEDRLFACVDREVIELAS